ncbi:PREDICTED: probable glucan endo-1,3-beta-glucosidase A6 [Ipomoea nil]|uniref:probable glucan endo-1,3-beta-glucosidase A6 n=1 Tax=Ipomoea nil TaxID=35883 RepID=UPI00090192BE|nr:PREDICTED: probable glucan endo-1,3-beta-glucosidase A6 [Ipomoea nil]
MQTFITFLLLSLLIASSSFSGAEITRRIGVCFGQLGNNLPSPAKSVELINGLKATRVKIYDANPKILKSLQASSQLQVSIMVPNGLIPSISSNQTLADQWVRTNVVPFYPKTMIRYLLVGNEILSNPPNTTWFQLVPAMRKIRRSLAKFRLRKIKVGTPLAMDMLESSFPPSSGTFRSDLSGRVFRPLLQFLNHSRSFFFFDVYPYFAWAAQPKDINLRYALMEHTNITYSDPGSGLTYTNLLDQMIDAVHFAVKRLGFPDLRLFIAETGWPNAGDADQIGANIYNAATYNRNVVKKFTANPPVGTPAMPGVVLPAMIFALYNENQKPGPGTERHFGLLHPNGSNVYEIDLSGKTPESKFKPLPKPTNDNPPEGKFWCVVAPAANKTAVVDALNYACGQGKGTCDPIQPGGKCYQPNSLVPHASYAFSSYWARFNSIGGTCYFNGLAIKTTKDPSHGSCKFPSVTL